MIHTQLNELYLTPANDRGVTYVPLNFKLSRHCLNEDEFLEVYTNTLLYFRLLSLYDYSKITKSNDDSLVHVFKDSYNNLTIKVGPNNFENINISDIPYRDEFPTLYICKKLLKQSILSTIKLIKEFNTINKNIMKHNGDNIISEVNGVIPCTESTIFYNVYNSNNNIQFSGDYPVFVSDLTELTSVYTFSRILSRFKPSESTRLQWNNTILNNLELLFKRLR